MTNRNNHKFALACVLLGAGLLIVLWAFTACIRIDRIQVGPDQFPTSKPSETANEKADVPLTAF